MSAAMTDPRPISPVRLSIALFIAFFASQSGPVVLAPTLPDIARDFGTTIGGAGQLRTVSALAAAIVALALAPAARRIPVRGLLTGGLWALVAGGVISGLAPSLLCLAVGQAVIGIGIAAVISAGLAAATDWPAESHKSHVLTWAIVGQPAVWVAGLPVVGVLNDLGWRWGWAIVPVAALAALLVVPVAPASASPPLRRRDTWRAWRDRRTRRWAVGELMAYAGWGGTLVYAGSLLAGSYDLSAAAVAPLLAVAGVAYFPSAFTARRRLNGDVERMLASLALALAVGSALFGLLRPSVGFSVGIFAVLVLMAGARSIVGSAVGVRPLPRHTVSVGAMRSVATQLGYLIGSAVGGVALDIGGYPALGIALAGFFGLAALPHLEWWRHRAARRAMSVKLAAMSGTPRGAADAAH
jgi:predicted MFS family arabinose efflux permease